LATERRAVGLAEVHVQGLALAVPETGLAAPGVVDQLVRAGQHARAVGRGDAAHGVQCQHPARTDLLQRVQVGAIVDPVRRQRVALAVAGQEGDPGAAEATEPQRARRCAVGRVEMPGLDVLECGQAIHAGAADHGQGDVHPAHAFSA